MAKKTSPTPPAMKPTVEDALGTVTKVPGAIGLNSEMIHKQWMAHLERQRQKAEKPPAPSEEPKAGS